jgi:uncharacterized protein (DUF58 family)
VEQARGEAMSNSLHEALDWGSLAPLRIRAREVADGVYAGVHRSHSRGPGVEFGGHRSYAPGDDLRWLDRHALMRHGRLLVREFETDTDRCLRLLVDASASMGFRSDRAPAAKLAYAALLAAALARIALASGDPVALSWFGGTRCRPLPGTGGREAFDRVVGALEDAQASGDLSRNEQALDRSLVPLGRYARRGALIVLLSDLLDLPQGAADRLAGLATRGRTVIVVRVLDPLEALFPFDGPVRLRSSEGSMVVETDGPAARAGYLAALEQTARAIDDRLLPRGGRVVRSITTDDPVAVVRAGLKVAGGSGH